MIKHMCRFILSFTLLAIAGCASSSPDMLGAMRHDIMVEGMNFVVFHRHNEAEVIRMGYLSRRDRDRVPALMQSAVAGATGCSVIADSMVTRIPGDTGVARFHLRC